MFQSEKKINIIQGSQINFYVKLINSITGDPYDLTEATSITTCFQNSDGTELTLSLGEGVTVVSPSTIGKILIQLTAAQTTAMLNGLYDQTLEISIALSDLDPIKVHIRNAYSIITSIC